MVVAQRTLDDEAARLAKSNWSTGPNWATGRPWTWQERLGHIVMVMIAGHRQGGTARGDEIRAKVWADFEKAMGPGSSADWVNTAVVPGRGGKPARREEIIAGPGLFRLILWLEDRDWYEAENRASAEVVIRETIETELGSA